MMGRIVMVLWLGVAAVVVVLGFVRLAPSDPLDWNTQPEFSEDQTFQGGVFRVLRSGSDGLAAFHAVAANAPRTRVLAGSVEDGMITYITRTRFIGFPDYTTARQAQVRHFRTIFEVLVFGGWFYFNGLGLISGSNPPTFVVTRIVRIHHCL
ncbi:hypothetical protein, partial [Phaeobacter sp.]|uniref:hypothetical protein n=1 Tax=Phaeobacter sp. TaxID=1902409 RepID=UPI0025D04DEB